MNKSFILFFVASLFAVAFAEEEESKNAFDDGDVIMQSVNHDYLVTYCKLLAKQGLINAITEQELQKKSDLALVDLAIKGVENAMEQRPFGAKKGSLAFLTELKEKLKSDEAKKESQKGVFEKLTGWLSNLG